MDRQASHLTDPPLTIMHRPGVPNPDPTGGPVADLQRYCATLAGFLRRGVPVVRQRLDALDPLLPPEAQRKLEDESGEFTFPYRLIVSGETLIVESLVPAILLLEVIAAATPENPRPPKADPELLLLELLSDLPS